MRVCAAFLCAGGRAGVRAGGWTDGLAGGRAGGRAGGQAGGRADTLRRPDCHEDVAVFLCRYSMVLAE